MGLKWPGFDRTSSRWPAMCQASSLCDGEYIKLNTNENPYPPSPRVFEAIRAAVTGDRLRKYPEPLGDSFRNAAAPILGISPEQILIGNGSDDILTILTRAYVPEGGLIATPTPSYILYRSLAEIQVAASGPCRSLPTGNYPRNGLESGPI